MQNKIRIIGGNWRGRQLRFIETPQLRPTPVRVRETLFNWLHYDVIGSRCLDLYAGSGALSFEAVSRGAKTVVQVENNAIACRALKENALALAATQVHIVQSEAFQYLSGDAEVFDLVFLDPPFGCNLIVPSCHDLEDKGWLSAHAKIYIETEANLVLTGLPKTWQLLKRKTAGDVAYALFGRGEAFQ